MADHTCTRLDSYIAVQSVPFTIDLFDRATVGDGHIYFIKDESGLASPANPITISAVGTDLVDGATSVAITEPYGGLGIIANQLAADGGYTILTDARPRSPVAVIKTADEVVNNSNTYQNDNHLSFAIKANEKWFFRLILDLVAVSATADFKFQWTLPASGTYKWQMLTSMLGTGAAGTPTALVAVGIAVGAANIEYGVHMAGWITNSSTAGTAQLQWAQNTATSEDSTVKAGSLLELRRVA